MSRRWLRLTRSDRQAHWFYEDFCRTAQGRALRSFSLREFAELMFEQHPSLEQHKARHMRCRLPLRRLGMCAERATGVRRAVWTASISSSRRTRCTVPRTCGSALHADPPPAAQRACVRRHHGEPRDGQVPHGERLEVGRKLGLSEGEGGVQACAFYIRYSGRDSDAFVSCGSR